MIECSSCGLMINKNDKKCPRCGHVFDVHKKQKDILTGVGAAAVGAGVIAAGVASHEKETKSTIKSVKNNAFKKSTEKIENTESVKKADLKVTTKNNNPKTDQTSTTAYGNKKYNDSLEINENNNSTKNDSSNSKKYNEDSNRKTNKTEEQMSDETTTSSKESNTKAETKTSNGEQTDIDIQYEGITQEDVSELIEKLKEKQGNEKAIEKILKEFSEDHKDDENLEALLELLMNGNETTTDADMNIDDSEDEDISKSSADGGDFGGGISISFAALENALACLGGSSLASNVNVITECKFFGSNGGLDSLFDEFESPEYDRIPENETSYEGYRKTISNFFNGENGEGGFTSTLKSKLEGLRESLIEMYGKDYYGEAFSREMAYQIIDENGEIDLDKALRLYNSTVKDGKYLDKDSMTQDEIDTFLANFTSNENINDYFEQTTQKVLEKIETINSDTYKSTDFYLKCEKEGRIPTEREVLEYYENYGDGIAADLLNGAGILGLTGILENKTINSIIGNRVQEGLYGRNTDENGDPTGEEIPDYDGKTDNQKRLEILTYSWYADNEEYQNLDQYKILSAYVDDYCETKDIDRVDLSIDDHLYQLLQAGASNALWDSEGNIRTRTYFDEETGEMSEQEKIIQRYERAITGGYNENGELDNHRDSEWRINRTTFEESFILSDNYVRKSDALTEATKNHSELFKVDDETKEIIYDDNKETSEYDENEKELYEIAKKASEEYKEALDAMNLFGFFVNQSQIDEAKQEAGENYSKDDYPAGVKEYLEYMNSDNKNPYQYMAKYDADNYSDAVEKFGDSMGSKVPHVIEIFSEMPSVKEGRITAEELAKNLSDSLSTNADYYHMYLESVEGQHMTNVTEIISLAKTRADEYYDMYMADVQTKNDLSNDNDNFRKSLEEKKIGAELAQEIGDSQARLSTISRDIETVQYNKIMAKIPSERTEEEKDFCMRYRIERTTSEQKEFIAQLNDYYEKLSNCENINEATQLLNYISMINENKLCNLEQVFEGKKLRLNEDFEEASKSIIARVEYTYEYDKDGVYGRVTYMYDSEGNKIEASEEEYELYLADLARKNGGELPFYYKTQISCELLEKINCLANNDTGLLTYKYHREDSETFKMDYKNYFQYGALVEATKEYEEYLAKLEKRGDFGDWITTAGYGAKAGLEQFADGFRSFMNPDGIKSISEYRSMLISSYLIETYGSDALNSNFMLGTYEISTSMANMLPSIALSMLPGVGQYLSLTAMFISSAGNSMEQAYQSGYTLEQSYIIGLISGALETGLQAFASGITSLGIKFAGGATVGARAVEKVVANAAKKEATSLTNLLLSNLAKGSLKRALAEYGINILSEGLEEGTQEILGPILENTVKYGIDYNDDFQEWKNIMNNMSLEEWQESKFIEWKAENLSNNTTRSQFFSLKDMTFEDWIKKCEKGEIYDLEGNALKIDLEEFNYLKSTSYTAKKWFDDNKSSTDIKSVLKSAIYGSISGGLFEGATHFAPEVISYSRTGTTLGMNSLVNAVRNQAAASGTPKNIFQIFAEVNQIIKDQSKTGKMSDLVANYLETSSFRSDYESFCNEMNGHLEEEISEVEFATMKVADNLAKTSLKNRLIESLNSTTYQSYQEILDARDRITRSEELIKNELEGLKSNENGNSTIESLELSESLLSELIKEREDSLKALAEKKAGLDQVIKMKESLTEDLKLELSEELTNIIESINSNESTVAELEQLLSETTNSNNSNSNSKAIEELENRIDGKTKELNNKKAKNEITKKQIEIKTKEIEQLQEQLKSLKENTKKGKEQETQKINETINKLKENIESNKARMNEIESITEIIANPKFELSSLTTEQFNNFISNLDYNSLKVYAKDIVSRLSDLSDTRISELIERLDPITLGVFENQVVERVKHITEEEVLNNIKDKNASKFTQNIYEIEVSADTTTNTTETVSSKSSTETVVSETTTETVSENTVGTEPSTNIRNNNSTETVLRETVKPENETSRTEAKKELVSQNAALGTVGLIQMGALTGGLKGNQTLNNVLETIQTDINSLNQRYDSTTINGEVNVETEVNVNEETNSNNNVREELKSQIDQKTKLYNDLTQLMSKYGVDGSELLTTLKEEIVSGKYKLEHQLLNTETNIEETITDSITESEAAIKEIMQQFDLTKVDQTTLNEARTAAMYKILEIANKNNISVDSILSKINIDEMLTKNDVRSELEIAAERLSGIVEETNNLTEEDFKILEPEEAEKYFALMKAINNIRSNPKYINDDQVILKIYNEIKSKSPKSFRDDMLKCVTHYIGELNMKMYKNNYRGTVNIDGININLYGKNDTFTFKLFEKSLADFSIYLKQIPPFMRVTITEINLFNFECNSNLFAAVDYYHDICSPFNARAYTNGETINFWNIGLPPKLSTLIHELSHNVDVALGRYEQVKGKYWTRKNSLWKEAIEKDGGRDHAISEYSKTKIEEDFADSFAEYVLNPARMISEFPNRAEIIQNILDSYSEVVNCSYESVTAIERQNTAKCDRLHEKVDAVKKTVSGLTEGSTIKNLKDNIDSNIASLKRERMSLLLQQQTSSTTSKIGELNIKIKQLEELNNYFANITKKLNINDDVEFATLEDKVKSRLEEKLDYEKAIIECRDALDLAISKSDLNNIRPDVLQSIREMIYGQANDIRGKYNKSIEEVLERINYNKIFSTNNSTSTDTTTITFSENDTNLNVKNDGQVETNIEKALTDSITESETAIKEIMQKFDLTYGDQTVLNEAKAAAKQKILEIANKNNVSVDSLLSKINIDEILSKYDAKSETKIDAERLNSIAEETDNLTEADLKHLEGLEQQYYSAIMETVKKIRNESVTEADYEKVVDIYNEINRENEKIVERYSRLNKETKLKILKEVTAYIGYLKMKMYEKNLSEISNIEIKTKTGVKTIKINKYGKNAEALEKCRGQVALLLENVPPFILETITEINLFDYDSNLDMFYSVNYGGDIRSPFKSFASSDGSRVNIWKSSLIKLEAETLFHELGHNIDKRIGKYELSEWWTSKDQLWKEAIDKDGKDRAPTVYAKTNVMEDFAESVAKYMTDPEFRKKFPSRAETLDYIFKFYTKKIDCSFENAELKYYEDAVSLLNVIRKNISGLNESSTLKDVIENITSNIKQLEEQIANLNVKNEELELKRNQLIELQNDFIMIAKKSNADLENHSNLPLTVFENLIESNLDYNKKIKEIKREIEEKLIELNNEPSETFEKINEFNEMIEKISEKYGISNEEIDEKVNLTKILSKIFDASQDTATIAPLGKNAFDSDINENTKNNMQSILQEIQMAFEMGQDNLATEKFEKLLEMIQADDVQSFTHSLTEIIEAYSKISNQSIENILKMDAVRQLITKEFGTSANMKMYEAILESITGENVSKITKEILSKVPINMDELSLARYLYNELGKKVDYSVEYKVAVKGKSNRYEELYYKEMSLNDIDDGTGIICINWAQLYSELLLSAGFDESQIIIQRLVDEHPSDISIEREYKSGEKFVHGSHAGIYVKLKDGSIIMPDITAPLGKNSDLYNVKAGKPTTGFILFSKEEVEELVKRQKTVPKKLDTGYKLINLDINGNEISMNIQSEDYLNFVNLSGAYLYGMEYKDLNVANEEITVDGKETTRKKKSIAEEMEFYGRYNEKNGLKLKEIDKEFENIAGKNNLFIEQMQDEIVNYLIPELSIEQILKNNISNIFMGLDYISNRNEITVVGYMNEIINSINKNEKAIANNIKIGKAKIEFSADGSYITINIDHNGNVSTYRVDLKEKIEISRDTSLKSS